MKAVKEEPSVFQASSIWVSECTCSSRQGYWMHGLKKKNNNKRNFRRIPYRTAQAHPSRTYTNSKGESQCEQFVPPAKAKNAESSSRSPRNVCKWSCGGKRKKKRKQICDKSRETLRRQIASSSAVTGTKCLGLPRFVPQSLWIIEALLKDTFIGILIPVVRSKKEKVYSVIKYRWHKRGMGMLAEGKKNVQKRK